MDKDQFTAFVAELRSELEAVGEIYTEHASPEADDGVWIELDGYVFAAVNAAKKIRECAPFFPDFFDDALSEKGASLSTLLNQARDLEENYQYSYDEY